MFLGFHYNYSKVPTFRLKKINFSLNDETNGAALSIMITYA